MHTSTLKWTAKGNRWRAKGQLRDEQVWAQLSHRTEGWLEQQLISQSPDSSNRRRTTVLFSKILHYQTEKFCYWSNPWEFESLVAKVELTVLRINSSNHCRSNFWAKADVVAKCDHFHEKLICCLSQNLHFMFHLTTTGHFKSLLIRLLGQLKEKCVWGYLNEVISVSRQTINNLKLGL